MRLIGIQLLLGIGMMLVALHLHSSSVGDQQVVEGKITLEDGIRLYYRKVGDAKNYVIVPNGLYYFDDFKHFAGSHSLIFYDVRNRGFSDPIPADSKIQGGIQQDVADLEAVRKHFGSEKIQLIGHSYVGMIAALYAMNYPGSVEGVIQIGPIQPDARKQYPPELTGMDETFKEVMNELGELAKQERPKDPEVACNQVWKILRKLTVADPSDEAKIMNWGRCSVPNEQKFMKYWRESIQPSIQAIHLDSEQLSKAKSRFLIIHGRKDRNAPFGGGRDWALHLPNARLISLNRSAHAPWVEEPEIVFNAIREFLNGNWPATAEDLKAK